MSRHREDDLGPSHIEAPQDSGTQQVRGTHNWAHGGTHSGTDNGADDATGAPEHRVERDQPTRGHLGLNQTHCPGGPTTRITVPGAIDIMLSGLPEHVSEPW